MGTFFRILDSLIPDIKFKFNLNILERWKFEAIQVLENPGSTPEEIKNAEIDINYLTKILRK